MADGCPEPVSAPTAVAEAAQPLLGATPAAAGEFPWMVSLQDLAGNHLCGGTIINTHWVLTSRQCVLGTSTLMKMSVPLMSNADPHLPTPVSACPPATCAPRRWGSAGTAPRAGPSPPPRCRR
ncbi:trypsin-like serine protease [Corallococcus aberystwythensis]|uniref:Peptidase S1 domain-containing protein n=1 Tax=Corallococcus aberystwythensis TaxID=2316722 RepID=A0A3A8PJA0_9BACT|nr:hypothetical protein D7W81_33965 [Corallococcus aberystwythensis]